MRVWIGATICAAAICATSMVAQASTVDVPSAAGASATRPATEFSSRHRVHPHRHRQMRRSAHRRHVWAPGYSARRSYYARPYDYRPYGIAPFFPFGFGGYGFQPSW